MTSAIASSITWRWMLPGEAVGTQQVNGERRELAVILWCLGHFFLWCLGASRCCPQIRHSHLQMLWEAEVKYLTSTAFGGFDGFSW